MASEGYLEIQSILKALGHNTQQERDNNDNDNINLKTAINSNKVVEQTAAASNHSSLFQHTTSNNIIDQSSKKVSIKSQNDKVFDWTDLIEDVRSRISPAQEEVEFDDESSWLQEGIYTLFHLDKKRSLRVALSDDNDSETTHSNDDKTTLSGYGTGQHSELFTLEHYNSASTTAVNRAASTNAPESAAATITPTKVANNGSHNKRLVFYYGDVVSFRFTSVHGKALGVRRRMDNNNSNNCESEEKTEIGCFREWLGQAEKFVILPTASSMGHLRNTVSRVDYLYKLISKHRSFSMITFAEEIRSWNIPVGGRDRIFIWSCVSRGLLLPSSLSSFNHLHGKSRIHRADELDIATNIEFRHLYLEESKKVSDSLFEFLFVPRGEPPIDEKRCPYYYDVPQELLSSQIRPNASILEDSFIIKELLHALLGCPGQVFILDEKKNFVLNEGLLFNSNTDINTYPRSNSIKTVLDRVLPLVNAVYSLNQACLRILNNGYCFDSVSGTVWSSIEQLLDEFNLLVCQFEGMLHNEGKNPLTLQKLWYMLHPSIHTFTLLNEVMVVVDIKNKSFQVGGGGVLLNHLRKYLKLTSDERSIKIISFVYDKGLSVYLEKLDKWLRMGELFEQSRSTDQEFMIVRNGSPQDHNSDNNLSRRRNELLNYFHTGGGEQEISGYWSYYSLRLEHVLDGISEEYTQKILKTGQYLNVIRECGITLDSLMDELNFNDVVAKDDLHNNSIAVSPSEIIHHICSHVEVAYQKSSSQLLRVLMKDFSLLGHLHLVKRYFLLDQGDFFVQFLDMAEQELIGGVDKISKGRIQSLLNISIQATTTSSTTTDNKFSSFVDNLVCAFAPSSLMDQLDSIFSWAGGIGVRDSDTKTPSRRAYGSSSSDSNNLTGMEAFMLDYRVQWPISLIITRKTLINYQVLFRHLFFLKHVERRLFATWLDHQMLKEMDVRKELGPTFCLRQRMLHFLQNFIYYMMFEVIEPHWRDFEHNLEKKAKTIDDVVKVHSQFQTCVLKECLLTDQVLLKLLTKLSSTCLLFTDQMRRFFLNMNIDEEYFNRAVISRANRFVAKDYIDGAGSLTHDEQRRRDFLAANTAAWRDERLIATQNRTFRLKQELKSEIYTKMIRKFEKVFDTLLKDFLSHLEEDVYLSNLCTRLDYNGYFYPPDHDDDEYLDRE